MNKKSRIKKGDIIELYQPNIFMSEGYYLVEDVRGGMLHYRRGEIQGGHLKDYIGKFRIADVKPDQIDWQAEEEKHTKHMDAFAAPDLWEEVEQEGDPSSLDFQVRKMKELH